MSTNQAVSKVQERRRAGFKKCALKIFKAYNENKLKSAVRAADKSGYKEWRDDYYALIYQGKRFGKLADSEFRVFMMAVYAWMPVLYSQKNVKKLKENILTLITSESIDKEKILESMELFSSSKHKSGSISALSKALHFCKPDMFPVWDTRVAKSLGRKSGTGNNVDIYVDYLFVMTNLKNDESLDGYCKNYNKFVDSDASKIRALEHGLFLKR